MTSRAAIAVFNFAWRRPSVVAAAPNNANLINPTRSRVDG
jgi:hypothetical protein